MYYWGWIRNWFRRPGAVPVARERGPAAVPPALHLSLALRHVDGGSCNGCEAELGLLPSPRYDFTRFGFVFTPSPRHADLLVVTGVITPVMAGVIRRVYGEMPGPKAVVAVGDCAAGRGLLGQGTDPLAGLVPVALSVGGCPPPPEALLTAFLGVAGRVRRVEEA